MSVIRSAVGLPIGAAWPSGKEVVEWNLTVQTNEVAPPDDNRRVVLQAATARAHVAQIRESDW